MALTLYRKYRPQQFSDITNQEHIKITLQNQITMGQVSHAYIFAGPRGVGKTTTARILAKAVNCEKRKEKESEPCNSCDACNDINAGKAMDIVEIDAASHTGVENVRENIIENVRFSPVKLKNKIFIIDEAHMLSTSAFNALLKTLEEPPEHVIFILATTEVHKIPTTIISRCQRFDFKKIDASEIVKRLEFITSQEKVKVDKKVLERIARLSEGCVRDSESLLGQVLALDDKKVTEEQADLVLPRTNFEQVIKLLHALSVKDQKAGVELVNQLVHDGVDLKQFSAETLEFLRELLLAKIMGSSAELMVGWSSEIQNIITAILNSWGAPEITQIIELMLEKQRDLKQAFPIQLPLELFVVEAINQNAPVAPIAQNPKPEALPAAPKSSNTKTVKKNNPTPAVKTDISLDTVKEKWQNFMSKLEEHNNSLNLIIGISKPLAVKGDTLELGLKYKFHAEQLMSAKNKPKIEEALSDTLGKKLFINAVVDANVEAPAEVSEDAVKEVMDTFGGKVVE